MAYNGGATQQATQFPAILTNEKLKWNLRNHGLFVGYAPTDKTKYAVCVIMEHAGSSSPAARATASIMKELLK